MKSLEPSYENPSRCWVDGWEKAMDIGVVCNRPSDLDWLIKLREWAGARLDKRRPRPRVISVSPIGDALRWRNELPEDRLVVTVGFKREEIEGRKIDLSRSGEPIILCERDAGKPDGLATASFAGNQAIPVFAARWN